MKKVYFISLLILSFTACSQEAEPYTEKNTTQPSSGEQGYIQTH